MTEPSKNAQRTYASVVVTVVAVAVLVFASKIVLTSMCLATKENYDDRSCAANPPQGETSATAVADIVWKMQVVRLAVFSLPKKTN